MRLEFGRHLASLPHVTEHLFCPSFGCVGIAPVGGAAGRDSRILSHGTAQRCTYHRLTGEVVG